MTIWDDRILEIVRADEDEIGKVSNLKDHDSIHVGQSQVSRRCAKLADHGLLRNVGDGVYLLTDEGRAYLNGKYDADRERYIDDSSSGEEAGTTDSTEVDS